MAITTQDGLVSGLGGGQRLVVNKASVTSVANRLFSMWSATGQPGVGDTTSGQTTAGVVPTSATTGAITFTNPASGAFSYLARAAGIANSTTSSGILVLYDMLWIWTSGGSGWSVTSTALQSTVSPPALTRPDSLGVGTELWLETIATAGTASGTSTITYTNAAGTGSRTASLLTTKISSPAIGTIEKYALASGDTGVRSVQSMQNSSTWNSGTYRLMIVRRIAELPIVASTGFIYDSFDLGLPRVYDSACIGMALESASTTTGPLLMTLTLAQG